MSKQRYFRYVGHPVLTRGEHGVSVVAAHTHGDGLLWVWDPDCGEQIWGTLEHVLQSPDWEEIDYEMWVAL